MDVAVKIGVEKNFASGGHVELLRERLKGQGSETGTGF
jgi:hypothetical protein